MAVIKFPGVEGRGEKIRITFRWRCQRQRETLDLKPTLPNLRAAAKLRAEVMQKIAAGDFDYGKYFPNSTTVKKQDLPISSYSVHVTFEELAERCLITISQLAKGTQTKYRNEFKYRWVPLIGHLPVRDIKFSDLAILVGQIEWTSAKARNNALIPLRKVFDMAWSDGLIPTDPAKRLKNQKAQRPQPDPLSLPEVEKILDYMQAMYDPQVFNYFEFAFFTGLRIGELIAVKWSDIDSVSGVSRIRVQRSRTKGEEKATKTYQVRDVDLNERAMQALDRQRRLGDSSGDYIFKNPVTGQAWNDNGKSQRIRYWNNALERLEIRHRTTYQTRHTYATMLLMGGSNPAYAAAQLGHGVQMFLNVYTKWITTLTQDGERLKVNQFIRGAGR